jgi:hypothetical protein
MTTLSVITEHGFRLAVQVTGRDAAPALLLLPGQQLPRLVDRAARGVPRPLPRHLLANEHRT